MPTPPADRPVIVREGDLPLERWEDETPARVVWRTLLSGDRTPTERLTLGVAELAPGSSREVRTHHHAPVEIYYVISGEGVVFIDGEEHPLRAGTAVYLPGDVEHAAANTGDETLRLLYVFATDSFEDVEYHFAKDTRTIG